MPSIILSDNGVSSGSAGLKSTAASDGALSLQTTTAGGTATTAISIDTSQNVTFTNQPTYSGGTANGVAYLNGSKALTTGSALVFDGTNLGVGTSSPLNVSNYRFLTIQGGSSGGGFTIYNSSGTRYGGLALVGNDLALEQITANAITFSTNNTERMRLDSSGNLGLGVTPSAWQSGIKAITVSGANVYSGQSGAETGLTTNAYYNAGWSRISTGYATLYQQYNGGHFWFNAGSGTGAITFTQAMTLTAAGDLYVGTTSGKSVSNYKFVVTNL